MRAISRKARYALGALYVLAEGGDRPPPIATTLAEKSGVPAKFLEGILVALTRAGLLTNRKGRGGGYVLARDAAEISVGQVIRVIDGPIDPLPCLHEIFPQRCDGCAGPLTDCEIRSLAARLSAVTARVLDGTSLADSAKRRRGRPGAVGSKLRRAPNP